LPNVSKFPSLASITGDNKNVYSNKTSKSGKVTNALKNAFSQSPGLQDFWNQNRPEDSKAQNFLSRITNLPGLRDFTSEIPDFTNPVDVVSKAASRMGRDVTTTLKFAEALKNGDWKGAIANVPVWSNAPIGKAIKLAYNLIKGGDDNKKESDNNEDSNMKMEAYNSPTIDNNNSVIN
jgi:hypothetical protein